MNNYKVNGRIWIETSEGAWMGKGRTELLLKIKEYGSVRKACKAMNMSYRQAWELFDSMNKKSNAPLVILNKGGKDGGRAVLTEAGENAITQFQRLIERFRIFMEKESLKFQA